MSYKSETFTNELNTIQNDSIRQFCIEMLEDAPDYFFMSASPAEEEEYIKGIQDIIGRVPCFGGSAADNTVEGK